MSTFPLFVKVCLWLTFCPLQWLHLLIRFKPGRRLCSKSLNFFCDQTTRSHLRFFQKKEKVSLLFQWENVETSREVYHLSQLHWLSFPVNISICCDSNGGMPMINYCQQSSYILSDWLSLLTLFLKAKAFVIRLNSVSESEGICVVPLRLHAQDKSQWWLTYPE